MTSVSYGIYATDTSAAGNVPKLHEWWNQINTQGPKYDYFTNLGSSSRRATYEKAVANTTVNIPQKEHPTFVVTVPLLTR